jgi:DNA (cytosine-5)-methyltransferase 1
VGFSEIEPFPSAVLQHHYPHVPNLGDMTNFKEWNLGTVDLLVGGTPCQSFSVAGLRKGLDDPRGNLMLTFLAIAERHRPRWIVWENVPGVLSSNGGRDFGTFLAALGELGYGWAYRVLDAQWFGVAQRRRRVFVVGCLGDQASAAQVLFERESVRRDTPPSREARQGAAAGVGGGTYLGNAEGGALDAPYLTCSNIDSHVNNQTPLVAQQVKCATGDITHPLGAKDNGMAVAQPVYGTDCYNGAITGDVAATLGTPGSSVNASGPTVMQPIAFKPGQSAAARSLGAQVDIACTLEGGGGGNNKQAIAQPVAFHANAQACQLPGPDRDTSISDSLTRSQQAAVAQSVATVMQVRRLTPVECERLQGFPDGWTAVPIVKPQPIKGQPAVVKAAADGPRYKALGNSMAVPCMKWIGERIAKCDSAITKK